MKQKEIWLFFKDQLLDKIIGIQLTLELVIDNLVMMKSGFMVSTLFMIMKVPMSILGGVLVQN